MHPADEANQVMVDQMIARGALWSRSLIEAFRATPRHLFLDRIFHYQQNQGWREVKTTSPGRNELRLIYSDRALTTHLSSEGERGPVPISSSSQPSLMAQMLEDMQLRSGLRSLEIGAGTGYNAALLARVVGPVISVDIDRAVLAEAERHLACLPERPVRFHHADGRGGYPAEAPYDRIMVTAATPDLEPAWLEQLGPGGRLLAPLDLTPGLAYLVCGTMVEGHFEGRLTRPAYFMPLREEYEAGRETSAGLLPVAERMSSVVAPWADWGERRSTGYGARLVPMLAFLGWLEGLTVATASGPDGRLNYGVGDLVRGNACWLGAREWRVTGKEGRELGERLWRTFLDAGGPWPTEFLLRAYPPGQEVELPDRSEQGLVYRRQGTACTQVWEMIEVRQRAGEF
jgi:protein-L-isoaspartate(D-aspartate) O-methyltransferase